MPLRFFGVAQNLFWVDATTYLSYIGAKAFLGSLDFAYVLPHAITGQLGFRDVPACPGQVISYTMLPVTSPPG